MNNTYHFIHGHVYTAITGITHDMKPPEEWDFARSDSYNNKDQHHVSLPDREVSHFHDKMVVTKKNTK